MEGQSLTVIEKTITRAVPIQRTPRVMQVEGIFDVAPAPDSEVRWDVSLALPEQWSIGLIVGPSGSGKTTVAQELWPDNLAPSWEWPQDKALVDGFPPTASMKDITRLLSAVGLGSVPSWLRPFRVLSCGEQFRANVARTLLEMPDLAVMDEFTSVVDRTVAKISSAAVAKAVRREGKRLIAVSCHYDVLEWLCPDWVYEPHLNATTRRSLRRPAIELDIARVHHSAWSLFRRHHYMTGTFNKAARAFVAFWQGVPVAFQAVMRSPHPKVHNLYRGHRAVCLPDYQGVGIGGALIECVASAYRGLGNRITSTTANPALNASRSRSPHWRLLRRPLLAPRRGRTSSLRAWVPSIARITRTWEYVGPGMESERAARLIYGDGPTPGARPTGG